MNHGLNYTLKLTDQVSKPLQTVKTAFGGLSKGVKTVLGMQAAFVGATGAITAFLNKNLSALDSIHQLSQVTGVGAKAIFTLGKMAEVSGSSVEATQNSILQLSRAIGEAAQNTGKIADFELYGLSAFDSNGKVKDTMAVLDDIRQKFKFLSEQEQIAMLKKLGIDKSMTQVLRLSNQELTALAKRVDAFSLSSANQENAQSAAAFKDSLTQVKQILQGIGQYTAVKLAPIFTNVIGRFADWYAANSQLVQNGLNKLVSLLDGFLKTGFAVISAIHQFVKSTLGWQDTIWALVAVFGYLKKALLAGFLLKLKAVFALAFSPLGVVILLVVSLIRLFYSFRAQIMAFVGGVITGFKKWGLSFEPIKSALNRIIAVFLRLFGPIQQVTAETQAFAKVGEAVGTVLAAVFDAALVVLSAFINAVTDVADSFADGIQSMIDGWQQFTDLISQGEWANALIMVVKGAFNMFANLCHKLKVTFLKVINGFIGIANKFGLNIPLIEIPVKAKVEGLPEAIQLPATSDPTGALAATSAISAKADNTGSIHRIAAIEPNTAALDNHKGLKGSLQQTNNNQRTYHISIHSPHTDAKAIVQEMRNAENKEMGR